MFVLFALAGNAPYLLKVSIARIKAPPNFAESSLEILEWNARAKENCMCN